MNLYKISLTLLFLFSSTTNLAVEWKPLPVFQLEKIQQWIDLELFEVVSVHVNSTVSPNEYLMQVKYEFHDCYMYFSRYKDENFIKVKDLWDFDFGDDESQPSYNLCTSPDFIKIIGQNGKLEESDDKEAIYLDRWQIDPEAGNNSYLDQKYNFNLNGLQISDEIMAVYEDEYNYFMFEIGQENETKCLIMLYDDDKTELSSFISTEDDVQDTNVSSEFVIASYYFNKKNTPVCVSTFVDDLNNFFFPRDDKINQGDDLNSHYQNIGGSQIEENHGLGGRINNMLLI